MGKPLIVYNNVLTFKNGQPISNSNPSSGGISIKILISLCPVVISMCNTNILSFIAYDDGKIQASCSNLKYGW